MQDLEKALNMKHLLTYFQKRDQVYTSLRLRYIFI